MLDHGLASLTTARADGRALAAFSTYNLEITMAVCRAAESTGLPVILQAGSSTFQHAGRDNLVSVAFQGARQAKVPVGVHLDHSRDIEEIRYCIEAGYTSVMVDGSNLPFEENIALTREVVKFATPRGVWVEGELGAIPGDEDRSVNAVASELTDPALADEFAERTGVAALAVAGRERPRHRINTPPAGPGQIGPDRSACSGASGAPRCIRFAVPRASGGDRDRRGEGQYQYRIAAGVPDVCNSCPSGGTWGRRSWAGPGRCRTGRPARSRVQDISFWRFPSGG